MSKRYTEIILITVVFLAGGCSSNPGKPAASALTAAAVPSADMTAEYRQAIALMQAEQWHDAIQRLEAITAQQPALSGPWLNLGISRIKTGDLAAAETALRKAIDVNAGNVEAYNRLGFLYRIQGRHDEARSTWETALGIAPDNPDIHWNLGILYDLYLPNPALALQHYERCRQLDAADDRQLQAWIDALGKRTGTKTLTAEAGS